MVSVDEILADVTLEMGDPSMRIRNIGYYRAQVKMALNELSFDSLFIDVYRDEPIPDDLRLRIPQGLFNIRGLWIYTGTPDDVGYQETVYWKRTFFSRGSNQGYTAAIKEGQVTDPFVRMTSVSEGQYYFNTQNGYIILSDSCAIFDYIRIMGSGLLTDGLDIYSQKIVPKFVQKAVILWAVEKSARSLKIFDNRYRAIQTDAATQLDEYGLSGAWHQAKRRLKDLDKKKYQDIVLYTNNLTA